MDKKEKKLSLMNISKSYASNDRILSALEDVSLDVYDNEFLVLLGPGRCGKSVLLNIISGIEQQVSGDIFLDGQRITQSDERISMVFQRLALFPWKTVMENVRFGLNVSGMDKEKSKKIAQKYIDLVKLTGFENSYPNQLSGGMKQRVGIARAYSVEPEVLLMDEPFGQLDAQTRYFMQEEVERIWQQEKRTIVFVTNNIEEAIYLADRVVLLTKCPATVKETYTIDLARPRDTTSSEFLQLRRQISEQTDLAL